MIKIENLYYSFPQKDLYKKISFTLEDNQHCAFIGTNGTGKSTLIEMIMNPDNYLFDGKLDISPNCRIGYVSQFSQLDKAKEMTVFDYISERFVQLQADINEVCEQMATSEELESLMEQYQDVLDAWNAIDGDNYESDISKQLKTANLTKYADMPITNLSGGEFKLVQVIKEMITGPNLLVMDEPDIYLDFEHLNALRDLINTYKGTLLVVTHNRYLLNHCFNKILHLENTQIQEFNGRYMEYNFTLLQTKIELQELAAADLEEIERNRKVVDKLRAEATVLFSATKGRTLHARVSLLERLEARRVKEPFVEIKQPEIHLTTNQEIEEETILKVSNLSVQFEEALLENVDFEIQAKDKVALIGQNGTGKTTLLRDIYQNENPSIQLNEKVQMAFLSQLQGEMFEETNTVQQEFLKLGLQNEREIKIHLSKFGIEEELLSSKIQSLSGGEKNLLQLAKIALSNANLLLLDEPTSHLDTYAQIALEKAIENYNGAILMVSHDFYTIANCMDYVLLIEDKKIRKMSIRAFRKMIYAKHFDRDYLEMEQKKKETEVKIANALQDNQFELAKSLSGKLEAIIKQL